MAGRGKRKGGTGNGFDDWGGYMAAKISKLENQYSNEGKGEEKESNVFSGVAIFVNGYTTPTAEELKRIMMANGGTYHHYYNSMTTTHIIASNLCDAKINKLKGGEKFIKPSWIVDSLKAGILLDFKPYMLYTGTSVKGQQTLQLTAKTTENDASEKEMEGNGEVHLNTEIDQNKTVKHKRAGEDDFLTEYYNRSRLHHISTMGALFKRHVSELREKGNSSPGIDDLIKWKNETESCTDVQPTEESVFMHIDMDCFFVSVGLRNYPWLQGKPVVVTHAKTDAKSPHCDGRDVESEFNNYKERWMKKSKFAGKNEEVGACSDIFRRLVDIDESCSMSEIASCSYEARAAGLYNGMFMGAALKLCPTLQAIPYDFEGYKEVSYTLYNTVSTYTLDIEAVSCDELYADVTSVLRRARISPEQFATHLRQVIASKTQCSASIGMGPNMLMARLSTKKAKPNGLFYIPKAQMVDFMKEHQVDDLPGVGKSIAHRLHAMAIQTCAEMQQVTLGKLQNEFGVKQGQTLYHMCRGEDKREIKSDHIRKSISVDINYGIRFTNEQEMYKFTQELSAEVSKRMEEIHVRGRSLTLKLKIRAKDAPIESAKFMGHGYCDSLSRSVTLAVPTRDPNVIHREVLTLLRPLKVDCCEMRGVGIQLSKLIVDNAKGKQLSSSNNTLLNFVSRHTGEKLPAPAPTSHPEQMESEPVRVLKTDTGQISESDPVQIPESEVVPVTESDAVRIPESVALPLESPEEESVNNRSFFELPSATQIDSSVFDQLPDDVKNDIRQEYLRKGISIRGITPIVESESNPNIVLKVAEKLPQNVPVSYEGIHQVSDIDSSYWSALPDEIKAEIEQEIQQQKSLPGSSLGSSSRKSNEEPKAGPSHKTSPSKNGTVSYKGIHQISDIDSSYWDAIPDEFKAEIQMNIQQSKPAEPSSPPSKTWNAIFKSRTVIKTKKRSPSKRTSPKRPSPKNRRLNNVVKPGLLWHNENVKLEVKTDESIEESEKSRVEHSLSGATTLSDIRPLLKDWFSSTETPEEEDRDEVSNYLIGLVKNNNLDQVEPIILFLTRRSAEMSDCWRKTVKEIVNHVQLYVIQHYNAPLKLPSRSLDS